MTAHEEDYDSPEGERRWADAKLRIVQHHLRAQNVRAAGPFEPVWVLAPYVCLWKADADTPGQTLWVIGGDLPTDYRLSAVDEIPRDAMRAFASLWHAASLCMLKGTPHPHVTFGDPHNPHQQIELGDLLKRRAKLLREFADDPSYW